MIGTLVKWARRHTRKGRYSPIAVAFHWTIAGLVVFQLWWGWRTGQLPVGYEKVAAYQVHSAVGVVVLVLSVLRILWRLMVPAPVNDADKAGWESEAAHLTHYTFYTFLILLPVSGWVMWSATSPGVPLSFGGILPWPLLPLQELAPETRYRIEAWAEFVHLLLVLALLALIPLHIGAAVKHEIVNRDDVVGGMVPGLEKIRGLWPRVFGHMRKALKPPDRSASD